MNRSTSTFFLKKASLGLFFIFIFSSCDQVSLVKSKVVRFYHENLAKYVSHGAPKNSVPVGDAETSPDDVAAANPDAPADGTVLPLDGGGDEPSPAVADMVPANEVIPPAPNQNLAAPSDIVPQASDSNSVSITNQWGVPVDFIDLKEGFILLGRGKKIDFYDSGLNASVASLDLKAPLVQVASEAQTVGHRFFLHEKGNIMEVVDADPTGIRIFKSFQVEAPSDGPFDHQLFILTKDKIKSLDITQLDQNIVLPDIPIANALQVFPTPSFLYVASGGALSVVNRSNFSVMASIPFEGAPKILGMVEMGGHRSLLLGLHASSNPAQYAALQWVTLSDTGGGFAQIGQNIPFTEAASNVSLDGTQKMVVAVIQKTLKYFDLERSGWVSQTPARIEINNVLSVGGVLVYATTDSVGKFAYTIDNMESPVGNPIKAPVVDRLIAVSDEKTQLFPSKFSAVWLPVRDLLLLLRPNDSLGPLFISKNQGELKPLSLPEKITGSLTVAASTALGLIVMDAADKKNFIVAPDLSQMVKLGLVGLFNSMDAAYVDGKKFLTVLRPVTPPAANVEIYGVDNPLLPKRLGLLALSEATQVKMVALGKKLAVACGAEGLCLVDAAAPAKMKILGKSTGSLQGKALNLAVSPDEKRAYVFYQKDDGAYISIADISGDVPKELGVIKDVSLTAEQFKGLSFSQGGKIILLPTLYGIYAYDVSNAAAPALSFTWDGSTTTSIDVTNHGKSFCAALGENGAICGNFKN